MSTHCLMRYSAPLGGTELGATSRLEDRPPTLYDVAHVLRLEVLDLARDQPLVATIDPLDTYAVVDSCTGDGADGGIHPWGISPRGQHADTLDDRHISIPLGILLDVP